MIQRLPLAGRLAALGAAMALPACAPLVPVAAGGALLGTAVVQERSTLDALGDTEIALGVQQRLSNHSGELYRDVLVDVTEGDVVLTGSVPLAEHKVAATRAAWATPGVRGVTDEIAVAEDGGTQAYLDDVRISNRVRLDLIADDLVRSVDFTVTTVDATVHLTGLARSGAEIERAVALARSVPGVRHVVSHVLTIDDPRRVRRLAAKGG